MLVKITESCSMGCSHCLSDCKPCDKHMTLNTLYYVLDFIIKNNISENIIISGGEPTEHPEFEKFIDIIIDTLKSIPRFKMITIATNGFWILENIDKAKEIVNKSDEITNIYFQVSTDSRYYPKKIDLTKRIWREKGFVLCGNCVEQINPMGRALENKIPTDKKASSCANVIMLSKQLYLKNNKLPSFKNIIDTMLVNDKVCTPVINYCGDIFLGESSLCTKCSSIFKDEKNIVKDILNFKCNKCNLNKDIAQIYKDLLNLEINI